MITATLPDVARITFRDWVEGNGWKYKTAVAWRQLDDFPPPAEKIGLTYRYLESALNAWKRKHPELGVGPFGRPAPPDDDATDD